MYRNASELPPGRRCPRDGHALEEGAADFSASTCPACHGVWLDIEAVVSLVLSDDLQAALGDGSERPAMYLADDSAPLRCPRRGTILRRYEYGEGSHVAVDACEAHGLWMDRHELGQLAVYLRAYARDVAPVLPEEAGSLRQLALRGPGTMMGDPDLVPGFWRSLFSSRGGI